MNKEIIQVFSTEEFAIRTEKIQEQIFYDDTIFKKSVEFTKPFKDSIPNRILINNGIELESRIVNNILNVVQELGDHGFFMSYPVTPGDEFPNKPYHWYIPINQKSQYSNLLWAPYQSILFSPSGKWGILVDFDFSILGGNKDFYNALINKDPTIEKEVHHFLDDCRYDKQRFGFSALWLSDLMEHIYGKSKGIELLRQYNLP